MRSLTVLGTIWIAIVAPAQINREKPSKMSNVNVVVQHFDTELEQKYEWGWIRWMMNSTLDRESAQTFGIVQINAGQHNYLHSHSNCEEILYVLSGSSEHIVGNKKVTLHAGPSRLFRVLPESVECCTRQIRPREPDRGERRQGELSEVDVVEPYHGEILGHMQTLQVSRA